MNKFKPLFDIPLAKYDNMDEYPPADKIKRALEAHFVNHPNAPKKSTTSSNAPATANNTTAGKGNKSKNKKRKRDKDKDKDKSFKSFNQSSSSQPSPSPVCSICGNRHRGPCWFKSTDEVPQAMRDMHAKREKDRQENKDKGNKDGKGKTANDNELHR